MTNLVLRITMARRLRALRTALAAYEAFPTEAEAAALQVARFNQVWREAWTRVPFYKAWRNEHGLPAAIESLKDLSVFPVLTKREIAERADLVARTPDTERSTLTGGTSGISTAFPMNRQDADSAWVNTQVGRAWNGLRPGERLFMLWGHSHLFGGKGVALKRLVRNAKDRLNHTLRVSAYNLDEAKLSETCVRLERFRPRYVIGYGSALLALCAHLEAQGRNLGAAGVARVVNTSESLDPDDADRIAAVFRCPVVNEYGMAELGVVGYSVGNLYPIRVLWRDYIVRTLDQRLLITAVGARCFPLINYDTEDLCPDHHPPDGALLALSTLQGKARDIFTIVDRNGHSRQVSVIIFDHILKQIPPLRSLHYELDETGSVLVRYTAVDPVPENARLLDAMETGLAMVGVEIDRGRFAFERIDQPLQTIAGKRRALSVRKA